MPDHYDGPEDRESPFGSMSNSSLFGVIGGISAVNQISSGIQQYGVAQQNAKLLKRIGAVEARESRRQSRAMIARQRSAAAANGVVADQGSALLVQAQEALRGEVEALRLNWRRKLAAQEVKEQGKAALIQGIGSGVSTLLSTGANIAKNRAKTPGGVG